MGRFDEDDVRSRFPRRCVAHFLCNAHESWITVFIEQENTNLFNVVLRIQHASRTRVHTLRTAVCALTRFGIVLLFRVEFEDILLGGLDLDLVRHGGKRWNTEDCCVRQ